METLIITNNPKVNKALSNKYKIIFYENGEQVQVLEKARDYIHLGAKLAIHPMSGRIRPNETPYKSIFLSVRRDAPMRSSTDMYSLIIIEDSIAETQKYLKNTLSIRPGEKILEDLQEMDMILLMNGIEEFGRTV